MKKYLLLIIILVLAFLLRVVALSSFPSGFNADEAALGYNAYSLFLTGKDEHGNFMPVNLESFGDYKPALYAYLLVPLVKFFGLTEFVVRLPSAIFGTLAVYLIFILTRLIFLNSNLETGRSGVPWINGNKWHVLTAEIAALLLAISPWHLHFSRGAWEVNLATTLILLGVVAFLRWIRTGKLFTFALCLLTFILSMYAYQSARVIAPLMGLSLVLLNLRVVLPRKVQLLKGAALLLIVSLPLLASVIFSDAGSRLSGVGLMADEGPLNFVKELRGQHSGADQIVGKLFHNRPVIYTVQFLKNYLSHFDGNFLFVNGDIIERNKIPETGLMYYSDFIFVLIGLLVLLRFISTKTPINNHSAFILVWLVLAPIASALTFQVPHALRAHNMVIPLIILCALGLVESLKNISKRNSKLIITLFLVLMILGSSWQFTRYLHQYYVHYPKFYPSAWQYGFRQISEFIMQNESRYSQVLITDLYDQPYILYLFYSLYSPAKFQANHELTARDRYNFSTVNRFDKFIFTNTNWDNVRDIHGSLIIAASSDIPPVGVNVVKTITFPGGESAYKIISN